MAVITSLDPQRIKARSSITHFSHGRGGFLKLIYKVLTYAMYFAYYVLKYLPACSGLHGEECVAGLLDS